MSWQPTGEEMFASIRKVSAERRASPVKFVEEFLEIYAAELSTVQLDAKWVELINKYPWYADELLHCLDETLAAPDPVTARACDLGQTEDQGGEVTREISTEEWHALGRRWLERLRTRFVPVYEQLTGGPRS